MDSRQNDWEARQELAQLQREMNRLARRTRRPASRRGARVFPSVIVSATDETLVVRAEIPGMKLEEFEISVSGEILTVQGSRITGEGLEGGWYHRRERESGGFSRAIRLPAEVEGEAAEASYKAGVLTITLPLRKPAKPRQIPVKVMQA
ncbi:MAG: Hsp20/alpha crystallin family protein [Anaerolineae bacterium]